jgi:calcium-dependent protein kinase
MSILKQLDHPNILKLLEIYDWRNYYYLITEMCDGGELFDKIRALRHFTEKDAAQVMKSILSAVVYMHKLGIVHRDLKPENMLYVDKSPTSNIKLIDFGTARKIQSGKKLTKPIGTAYYIAPEVINKDYDEKCDVWSCGVILYILLCGYPPFRGVSENEIM